MKLRIYMKSGNVIVLPGIKNYKIKNVGNAITYLQMDQTFFSRCFSRVRLLIQTIDLSQIEAITVS